jgi:hypothetical protein
MGKQYTDPVEFFLDMAAESIDGHAHRDFEPSDQLNEKWAEWRESVSKAMLDWGAQHGLGDEVAEIIQSEDMFEADVYFTLGGHGVGIWDGRWDKYLTDAQVKSLESYLGGRRTGSSQGVLGKQFHEMEMAFDDEANEHITATSPKVHKMSLHGVSPRQMPSWARPPRR